jgi:hypothetical protein
MPLILVGVHRTAEDQHGAVRVEGLRQRRVPSKAPFVEPVPAFPDDVAKGAGADLLAVDDRENVDTTTLR